MLTLALQLVLLLTAKIAQIDADAWSLSDTCPAGFAVTAEGTCELQTLYARYGSLRDSGVGGLKTGLPNLRTGFTAREIDLGRLLFFDPALSSDGSVSCASCHVPELGFSDGLAMSVGVSGKPLPRSAPSLWNTGFLRTLYWDGRASSLEEQMLGPLYAADEMGTTPERLLERLNGIPAYRKLFRDARPDQAERPIRLDEIYRAITAFEASLVSLNSRYDLYAHGIHEALTQPEIEGMNVFRSFVARCAECHTPPLFTNQQIAVIGTPEPEGMPRDVGAAGPTGDETQRGGFRVPSLRNIAKTAPYMHSGRYGTLREAVAFYTGGRGHAVPPGEDLKLHWHIWEPQLTDEEIDRVVDFLGALTDEQFMPQTPDAVPSGLPVGGRQPQPMENQP
ncbi:MAG: cytochrome c peroxidase [Pseudomonadota bacterium]